MAIKKGREIDETLSGEFSEDAEYFNRANGPMDSVEAYLLSPSVEMERVPMNLIAIEDVVVAASSTPDLTARMNIQEL